MKKDSRQAKEALDLASQGQKIAKPKVIYRESLIESKGDESVLIDGVALTSHILRTNLDGVGRVFPFLATCGIEIEEWSNGISGFLQRFWADTVKSFALGVAFSAFCNHLNEKFNPGQTSIMNPGSLEDWPIQQQKELFSILKDTNRIGVRLNENLMMIPVKSLSGLMFSSEEKFINCQLCKRKECPGRMAEYNEMLVDKYKPQACQKHMEQQ
jgi:hypothetical protein